MQGVSCPALCPTPREAWTEQWLILGRESDARFVRTQRVEAKISSGQANRSNLDIPLLHDLKGQKLPYFAAGDPLYEPAFAVDAILNVADVLGASSSG